MNDSKSNFEIRPIFPELIYVSELEITEKLKEFLLNVEMRQRYPLNLGSVSTHLLHEKNSEVINIRSKIEEHLRNYVKQILGDEFITKINPYITQSWLNVVNPNGHHHPHMHSNSFLSGILYIKTVEDDRVEFIEIRNDTNFKFREKFTTHVKVFSGNLLLFNSNLPHGVPPNSNQTENRISLSFNTFVDGLLGEEHSLSQISLNRHEKYK